MNKPQSLPTKDFLIRTLALKLAIDEKIVEAVVNHQFSSANQAMDVNNSIEFSGFGTMRFNNKKAERHISQLNKKMSSLQDIIDDAQSKEFKKKRSEIVIAKILEKIKQLKPKIEHD